MLDIRKILDQLPHRYPMLLVDRVESIVKETSIVAIKNVSINEPFFQGHFPQYPVMPGVLILEALAQAAGILSFSSNEGKRDPNTVYYFVGIDNARFKKPVLPGDQMKLHIEVIRATRGIYKFSAKATVEDAVVCEAELMCTMRVIED